jgi:hypothetical protein
MPSTPEEPPSGVAPADGALLQAPHGRLQFVAADGTTHDNVDVVRGFPVSAPDGPVAIVAADGRELAWIECLDAAAEPLRSTLRRELAVRDFLPVIERIEAITAGEPTDWSVDTDRGRRRFRVAHGDDVVRLPDGAVVVTDTDGLRYRIPTLARLTPQERHLVERAM